MSDFRITMGSSQVPILQSILKLGVDQPHAAGDVTQDVIANLTKEHGLRLDDKAALAAKHAVANAAMELRQKLCLSSESRAWKLTDLGRSVAQGTAPLPKRPPSDAPAVRVNTSRKASTDSQEPPTTPAVPAAPASKVEESTTEAEDPDPPKAQAAQEEFTKTSVATPEAPQEETRTRVKLRVVEPIGDLAERVIENQPRAVAIAASVVHIPMMDVSGGNWVKDPYIRGIVAANQDCFGHWHPKSPECGQCALAIYCRNAQGTTLSVLGERLHAEEVLEVTKTLHAAVATAMSPNTSRVPAVFEVGKPMRANFDGVCALTGQNYTKGEDVILIPGQGVSRADARK